MDSTIQTIAFLIIMLALVTVALASAIIIRRRAIAKRRGIAEVNIFPPREIGAYNALPQMVGLSIEAGRPLLVSTGASTIGDERTILALAALNLTYYTTKEIAISDQPPIVVTNQALIVPLASDMLKRAYLASGRQPRPRPANVRWYGTLQKQSLVFAAMLAVTMESEHVTGSVLLGNFGAEVGLVLGAAQRKSVMTIAGSDDIVGQAVAFAMADNPLIGEDIFTPASYLGGGSSERGSLIAQDFLRGVLIAGILVIALVEVAGEQVAGALAPLLSVFGG